MRLRILMEPRHGASYEQTLALARTTEESGFDAFFRSDHYLGIDSADPAYTPTDSWTTLAGLAIETQRVRLGTLMTASTFRYPGPLAICVATVDAMSGGRVELGIGAAWYEREYQSFGIPFPSTGERFDRLEEQLAIITGLWTTPAGQRFSFGGKHFQIDECANFPRPHSSHAHTSSSVAWARGARPSSPHGLRTSSTVGSATASRIDSPTSTASARSSAAIPRPYGGRPPCLCAAGRPGPRPSSGWRTSASPECGCCARGWSACQVTWSGALRNLPRSKWIPCISTSSTSAISTTSACWAARYCRGSATAGMAFGRGVDDLRLSPQ